MSGPDLPSLAVYGVDYHGVGINLERRFPSRSTVC